MLSFGQAHGQKNIPPSNISTHSVESQAFLTASFPVLSSILHHGEAINPQTSIPRTVLSVFSYALISTRAQRKRNAIGSMLLPVHNHRVLTNKLLHAVVVHLFANKDYAKQEQEQFWRETEQMYSTLNKGQRDLTSLIKKDPAYLLERSEHAIQSAVKCANDVFPQTTQQKEQQWEKIVDWARQRARIVKEDKDAARKILGNKVDQND